MRLLSAPTAPLDLITRAQLGAANVAEFGAVPNDPSKAANNDTAFNLAIASGRGAIYVPEGTWWKSDEIMLPSYTRFFGAGIGRTIIKTIDGITLGVNVVTNAHNNRVERSDYDVQIFISDMTIHANAEGRSGSGNTAGSSGCCIALSQVKDCRIDRVEARNGVWNNIDIAAAYYATGGTSVYAPGPSINVTVRDCISIDPWQDDAFTSHFSRNVKFRNCEAYITDGMYASYMQNGFEIDEGSIDCSAVDCYAYRFSKGYQSKGHSNTPGAVRSTFERCTAESCGLSFTAESTNLTGRNVKFLNCRSLTPNTADFHNDAEGPRSSSAGSGYYAEARAVEIKNTDGCVIKDLEILGGAGNNIVLQDGLNYLLDGVDISSVPVNRITGMDSTRGFIQLWGDSSENFTVRNVVCRTALTYRLVRVAINNPGTPITIEDIRTVGNQAATTEAAVVEWKAGISVIKRVTSSGYGGGNILPAPLPPMLGVDSGYPVAATASTVAVTVARITVPAMPYARVATCVASVYTTASDTSTAVDVTVVADGSVKGRSRKMWRTANSPDFLAVTSGPFAIPASGSKFVVDVILQRAAGSGTFSSSISSSFTSASVLVERVDPV